MMRWLGLPARPRLTVEQHAAFLEDRAALRSRMLKAAVVCVLIFYLACFLFDLWLLGDVTILSAVLRFGVMLPIAIGLLVYIAGNHPIDKKEIAAFQLERIELLAKMLSEWSPAVAESIARKKVAGGEVLTFTLSGSLVPWDFIAEMARDEIGESEDLDAVITKLGSLDIVIAVGIIALLTWISAHGARLGGRLQVWL